MFNFKTYAERKNAHEEKRRATPIIELCIGCGENFVEDNRTYYEGGGYRCWSCKDKTTETPTQKCNPLRKEGQSL